MVSVVVLFVVLVCVCVCVALFLVGNFWDANCIFNIQGTVMLFDETE